jgi:hypothetical protein
MAEITHCNVAGCEKPATASLDMQALCVGHFIFTCYARLEEYAERLRGRPCGAEMPEHIWAFVTECTHQVVQLAQNDEALDNLERARLLDILLTAYELGRKVRRGPRVAVAVPVRLRSEGPGEPWEEATHTRMLSRHGALVEVEHRVENEDTLLVERLDNGKQARARVRWRRRKSEGPFEFGIEFLDCDNFWELDWTGPQPPATQPEPAQKSGVSTDSTK